MKKERKSFILYTNFINQFDLLDNCESGELIKAIFQYVTRDEIYNGNNTVIKMAFSIIKDTLDRDNESYERVCERNSVNGKKGGRPKKETQKSERFFEKPKKADNDNDNGNEKEKEKENENDNGNGNGIGNGNEKESENGATSVTEVSVKDAPLTSCDAPLTPCDAPLTPCDTPYDSPSVLTQKQRESLIFKGVSEEYINERLPRAQEYAEKNDRSAFGVLMSWWEEDKRQRSFVSSSPPYAAYRNHMREESEMERRGREAQEWFDRRIKQTFGE